jgi:hypothetical protein
MFDPQAVEKQIRELRLSAWIFGFFTVCCALITGLDMWMTRRIDPGWAIGAFIGGMAWFFVLYVAGGLAKARS